MSYRDVYIAERTMHLRVEERLQQAEVRRMQQEQTSPIRGWLSRQNRMLVCELGYRMVVIGAWLERYGLPQSHRLESGLPGGNS
jgi:predicted RNA-binding protein associated with RNAse of E/G family